MRRSELPGCLVLIAFVIVLLCAPSAYGAIAATIWEPSFQSHLHAGMTEADTLALANRQHATALGSDSFVRARWTERIGLCTSSGRQWIVMLDAAKRVTTWRVERWSDGC